MANTIRASKNTFNGGLVMDLAPDTTPNEVLTSALNATLITFNGNELLLQNDMGNGRVETARLPEGYIPVGTCEFGDIIYIVSYNPLTNRSQIGCFPSPERLISSEEVGSNGQGLDASDFQELGENARPTGKLVANSVKKILYNNELNPGDKFIIYDKNNKILNEKYISDIGNTDHIFGAFPKFLKIHVVAIEDSGKINYLDSTIRWYDGTDPSDYRPIDYYIRGVKDGVDGPDIDSYRNKLSSGYSVFQSKISGKLALLIELEKITGFSCTHTIYTLKLDDEESMASLESSEDTPSESNPENPQEENSFQDPCIYKYKNTKYISYINFTWETENNDVNPCAVILTESKWVGRDSATPGQVHFWKYYGTDSNNANYGISELSIGEGKGFSTDKFKEVYYRTNGTGDPIPELDPVYSIDPEAHYYETSIDNPVSLESLRTGLTYDAFNNESYNYKLLTFYNSLDTNYNNLVLSKLNIKKDNDGYPILGYYYINAVERRDNKIYSKSSSDGKLFQIDEVQIPDYIVNNYFHYPVYKKFLDFIIPTSELIYIELEGENNETTLVKIKEVKPDITNMVYKYQVTPAMPYGLLEEFAVTNYIDFSKLGSGEIKLRTWKYFCGENMTTLTFGLDAYEEENMGIQEVAMEFYDNQGVAAVYHIENKASYSGQFTEIIPLNGSTRKSNMNATNGDKTYIHCGTTLDRYIDGCLVWNGTILGDVITGAPALATDVDVNPLTDDTTGEPIYYMNDCGTLYYGMLYLVKIIVKYCPIDVLGNYDTSNENNFRIFYRWMWTTTMYNDNYYQVEDFNELPFELTLDANLKYETTSDYYYSTFDYDSPANVMQNYPDEIYKHLSAKVQVITDKNEIDTTYIDNQGNTPGGGGSGGGTDNPDVPEDPPLWSNWRISYSSGQLELSLTCTKTITGFWSDRIQVWTGDTQITTGYTIAKGDSLVKISFTTEFSADLPIQIKTITTDDYRTNWAYVHMKDNTNSLAPDRTLDFYYRPTGS